ncbi:hypothetical protein BB934_45620 (plasmid) [Microvirga ossetica]|uniref:Uncharacterized protein n=1 Tax=Microvirga ossetica TaxID=1882682 RepID=A0A1B2EZZ0_9HYPH|nr:hypothetical protein [Microvirga ossetica]ANY85502.1 hypothetical protein BB934_45620 [Microvirga ossetica]
MSDYGSNARFICPNCQAVNVVWLSVPEPDYTAEKMSDMDSEGEDEVTCTSCGETFMGSAQDLCLIVR